MAEEAADPVPDSGGAPGEEECPKCEKCKPGLPGWMATFSDLVTLLLTFFVLLLSFAKTESAKYEAALGSIRNAFGGNVLKKGEVIQLGKSSDNQPTMVESQAPVRPFPIEFLTMEGMLDKHEINRASAETLNDMKVDLGSVGLSDSVDIYEETEGIKVNIKDKIYFKDGTTEIESISIVVFERVIKLLSEKNWKIFIKGHASLGEAGIEEGIDSYRLSSMRATAVAKSLVAKGISPKRITIVSYGDTRPVKIRGQSKDRLNRLSRRVEFMIRKRDLETEGHKVDAQ